MKVLFLESYFKPERTAGAQFSEEFRRALVAAGHTMQIYAPTPTRGVSKATRKEYAKHRKRETEFDGAINIKRFSLYGEGQNVLLRAIRYVILDIRMLFCGLTAKNINVNCVGSTPPINGLVATMIKKVRKIPYVYTVQDLFPESLAGAGIEDEGSFLWNVGLRVSDITYKNAEHIIASTDSIRNALLKKGIPNKKISVIYNWIDTEAVHNVARDENPLFDELSLPRDKFYVTYAGNIGNSQNVEMLAECAEMLKDFGDIEFIVFGDGSAKAKIEKSIADKGLKNIRIFPMLDAAYISEVYSLGNVSFVVCKRGVGKSAFPSKAASIMAAGVAMIASFDEDSDLCETIRNNELGECVEPENAQKAAEAVLKLYRDRNLCEKYGANGRRYAVGRLSKEVGTAAKVRVLEKYGKK